jgi:uncharacterized protein YdhG (YjbR/CyaY superfamily)
MGKQPRYDNIDNYLATLPQESRNLLEEVRRLIKEEVPDAVETISYAIPAFKVNKVFVYFAAFKKHIGIYPPLKDGDELLAELAPYRGEKGNLQFLLNQPLPYELIRRLVIALARENGR